MSKKKEKNDKNSTEIKGLLSEDELKKRKSRKTKTSLSVFVLLLALGLGGNWYWQNSDISSKISSISSTKTLGEATYVDATTEITTENNYFSSARVDRQNARDKSLEELQSVISSTDKNSDAYKVAAEKIASISSYIQIEDKIESLVEAKGVKNCLAVVNEKGDKVDIIVDSKDLSDEVILQIKEIATEQLSCSFENVTIIQSK